MNFYGLEGSDNKSQAVVTDLRVRNYFPFVHIVVVHHVPIPLKIFIVRPLSAARPSSVNVNFRGKGVLYHLRL